MTVDIEIICVGNELLIGKIIRHKRHTGSSNKPPN